MSPITIRQSMLLPATYHTRRSIYIPRFCALVRDALLLSNAMQFRVYLIVNSHHTAGRWSRKLLISIIGDLLPPQHSVITIHARALIVAGVIER
ncbi:hypothetical protein M404DRAFT_998095 [Pisolithus tinctorius Marx 270]|uniref:Uncharacterized protein n=1 Tax=Pisolithus tinctorius Marx 270 TaxID=870435 RepID=A0A0C3P2V2_PISTI|nr:hypothetical protein M404DRAFT_998095 [Pisolithus tinctorius Marx 270]